MKTLKYRGVTHPTLMLSLLAVLISCGEIRDTGLLGDNKTAARPASVLNADESHSTLAIIWDTGTEVGATLPDSYFDNIRLRDDDELNINKIISSISYDENKEITVTFLDLSAYTGGQKDALSFSMDFLGCHKSRGCSHPDMEDVYSLNINIDFKRNRLFPNVTVDQSKQLGGI